MSTSSVSNAHRHKTAIFALLAAAIILLLECFAFNLQFWSTLGASRDSVSALNTLGPGLTRQKDGTLLVTDPTTAFLSTKADGSSPYVRLDSAESTFRFTSPSQVWGLAQSGQNTQGTQSKVDKQSKPALTAFHIRVDAEGQASAVHLVATAVSRSCYLRIPRLAPSPRSTDIKVWVDEPAGTQVDIAAVHANVRVPFHASWGRVAAMFVLVALIALWMPTSVLWQRRLDTSSVWQRLAFAAFILVVGAYALVSMVQSIAASTPSAAFRQPGAYTYDFHQYGHLADSLLHGQTTLDLPVPQGLKDAANPYDPQTRETMLRNGVTPIYWDYALYRGHWYSYFGMLPALLLFAPYRLLTSLFVPGGLILPADAAVAFLLFLFTLFGSLLVIRLLKRLNPKTSLATVSMAIAFLLLGSQVGYLAFRMNFYSVPFAASLALSLMGLWFWSGSSLPHRHTLAIGSAPALSWPHLAAGSLCIAANFGCRPTFALVSLLAFPIFWPQIRAIFAKSPATQQSRKHKTIAGALASILLPALIVVVPLCFYNAIRFGSPLNFGDRYQLTVADMTHYRNSPANLLPMLGYYLLLPLRISNDFPFLSISPTPLAAWCYKEPLVGGLFMLCPALLLIVLLLLPAVRRRIRRADLLRVVYTALPLALLLLLVDILKGGIGWRYMVDFGWLVALSAIVVAGAVLGDARPCRSKSKTSSGPQAALPDKEKPASAANPHNRFAKLGLPRRGTAEIPRPSIDWGCVALRLSMLLLLLLSVALAFLIIFVPGREGDLSQANPAQFQAVASWFVM